jgi:hypothetical protein
MRGTITLLFVLVVAGPAGPPGASAQRASVIEFGALNAFDESLAQIGYRYASLTPQRGGAVVAVATLPDALTRGAFFFIVDLGVGFPMSLGQDVRIAPHIGVSMLGGGAAGGGGGGALGVNGGVGALARLSPQVGVHMDYTQRRLLGDGESYPFSSVTFGIAWLH